MLLQSAGFLDIDKLIEYRPPEELVTFWKRPVAPQCRHTRILQFILYTINILTVMMHQRSGGSYMPLFKPLQCSECGHTIRGCMFKNTEKTEDTICESCYRDHHYREGRFLKQYKHCVLDSITKEDSQRICRCSTVSHIDPNGRSRKLFPVNVLDAHRGSSKQEGIKCGLLNLGTQIAEAKYQGMLSKHEKRINLADQKRINKKIIDDARMARPPFRGLKTAHQTSLINPTERVAEGGDSTVFEEDEANDDVPFFLKKFTNKYPFGNVHMALRIGPLIIENGVEQYVVFLHK